jgi:hypothetical protein
MADPSERFAHISSPCLQKYTFQVCLFASFTRQRRIAKGIDSFVRSRDLPELAKTQIWLSDSSSKMWNIARVPRPNCDILTAKPHPSSPDARSIVVLIHDFFYVVEMLDESCKPHSPGVIEQRLWSCVRDVERRLALGEHAKPIGILSADDRNRWAKVEFLLL